MAERRTEPAETGGGPIRSGPGVVLLVDDDSGIREIVRAMMQLAGFEVLVADSGEQALAAAAAYDGPIDLLLTDVVMPGIQGPELAQRITAQRPLTRVMLMSGVPGAGQGVLVKPFGFTTLMRAVRKALGASRTST